MRNLIRNCRWWLPSTTLLAIGGCVTNQQLMDFTRTEFARQVADSVGRLVQIAFLANA